MIEGCVTFYIKVMKRLPLFKKEHDVELAFNQMCMCTVLCFGSMLVAVGIGY